MQSETQIIKLAINSDILGVKKLLEDCFDKKNAIDVILKSMSLETNFWVAKIGGDVVGYIEMYITGDIASVAVDKEYRGKGIGKELLNTAIKHARENGIEKLFLEVRISNETAIKLYEKNGFKQISRRKKYYEDGEDAWVYCLEVGAN